MSWIDNNQQIFFENLIRNVKSDLCGKIEQEKTRFPSFERLLARFDEIAERFAGTGLENLSQFIEIHNELCVAVVILEDKSEFPCERLDYEPPIEACSKLIDFRAEYSSSPPKWLEVKTIHPTRQDDWNRYKAHIQSNRFPCNAQLIFDEEWMGGELYHFAYAARTKILEYTIETEEKIERCLGSDKKAIAFLVLFSNGFHWSISELEDFVYFYRSGSHFEGDHFRKMEDYYLSERSITLKRNIDHFTFIKRPEASIRPVGGNWSVPPTRWPI
ncbi:MAG: hypothetical protein FVQ80_15810 [Planctomycetes bacterium]|nr:hypothetical protein [Planctomycetota bacterium]